MPNNLFGRFTKLVQTEAVGIAGVLTEGQVTGHFSWWTLGIVVLMGLGTYTGDNTPRS